MSSDATARPAGLTVVPSVRPVDRVPVGLRVKGRYRIVSELGAGAFGHVCLVEDETGGHEMAIRFLPRELADSFETTHMRRRPGPSIVEASSAHPALVRVLEFGKAEHGQTFVAMELAHGRRLSDILSEGPLDMDVALRLAIELGGAVEALHNMGHVHGALRPRNVMVSQDGHVKLMDVELAGLRAAPAMQGIVADEPPPEYLSPEQIRQVLVTETTDIYAFAAIVYEMLCGRPPFQATTREAVLAKHLTKTPIPMRRRRHAVPASVESVIALALSKVPEPRPPMQTILNCLWQEAKHPASRWKRKAAIIGGGALAASIALAAGWVWLAPAPPAPPPLASPAPAAAQAPIDAPPASRAPSTETGAAPTLGTATPATVPSSAARATPPSALAPASPPRRAERQEQQRAVPQPPAGPAGERPAASSNTDEPDPGAFVDWLLEQRGAARRGQ